MQSEPILIQFTGFTFQYRSQSEPTITDINLSIHRGEKIIIVGPSGSGKSTLGHCINGLAPFFYPGVITGALSVAGQSTQTLGIDGLSRHVGTVLQDTDAQFIGLTVGEDIAYALENDCVPQAEMHRRVAEVAAVVDLIPLLPKSPHELSGGQKQRVTLAGVMVDEVDCLLFDEPLANLDPATAKRAIELIDRIHRDTRKTILIIEHRLEDALHKNADRILVVNDGHIVADLPPADLIASNILAENGLREPLYVTAMKYAGIDVTAADHPETMDTLDLKPHASALQAWFARVPSPPPAPPPPPLLAVDHLTFAYDEAQSPVVADVTFTLGKGEFVSIVGTNGAGKSTLSKLICGFERPNAGGMRFEGADLSGMTIAERAEGIGLVLQNPNQMISKPMILEEVSLGAVARGWDADRTREAVERTLKICGLYPFRNWPVSALSYGQKKRVTIASILLLEPRLVILDEPTAGQDLRHYTEIMEFLRELNETLGLTIVMITHDMHLMLEYTKRALVMSNGKLIADRDTASVLADEAILAAANLKKTSLFEMAERLGLPPREFIARFIAQDEERRRAKWR